MILDRHLCYVYAMKKIKQFDMIENSIYRDEKRTCVGGA